jgi:hypothetical protein
VADAARADAGRHARAGRRSVALTGDRSAILTSAAGDAADFDDTHSAARTAGGRADTVERPAVTGQSSVPIGAHRTIVRAVAGGGAVIGRRRGTAATRDDQKAEQRIPLGSLEASHGHWSSRSENRGAHIFRRTRKVSCAALPTGSQSDAVIDAGKGSWRSGVHGRAGGAGRGGVCRGCHLQQPKSRRNQMPVRAGIPPRFWAPADRASCS